MNQQPTIEPYKDETLRQKVKKMPPKLIFVAITFALCIAFLLAIVALIIANREVQKDYNTECGELCYDAGKYQYQDEMCTCYDANGHTTNYFIMDGEYVQVGVEKEVN